MSISSQKNKICIIDIGSNTVLMTCGYLEDGSLKVTLESQGVARLGEGLSDGGNLQPEAKTRVLALLKDFQKTAKAKGINKILAAGTAAFRRAKNGIQFASEINTRLGIPTKILTGDQEAHFSYASVVDSFGKEHTELGMIDIGGGSTEFVFNASEQRVSLPIGTVRLLENFISRHPISDSVWDKVRHAIRKNLVEGIPSQINYAPRWVAVAATPTTLASVIQELSHFDISKIHGYRISKPELWDQTERLRKLSIQEREELPGMLPKRAELLPLGAIILWEAMNYLHLEEILVSHQGLRYGIILEELKKAPI